MDASLRRGTYGRIPGLAALSLFALAALSVIFVSTSVGGLEGPSLASHIYRREAGAGSRLVWRQEAGEEAADTPGSGSGGNNGTKAFETSTRTTSSTTSEGVITTTTSTRNTTSTTTTSVSTTTVISTTTTRSTTSSLISTTSSSVSRTSTSSTSSIPSSTSSSSSSSSSSAFRSATTATPDTPATTLVVPADFLTLTTSAQASSTQTGNDFAGESNSPTPTATAGEAVGAAQKGFFQNKGAVAGVFVVVALVAICLLGLLFIHVARRRAAARQRRLHAELFGGKYSKSEDSHDASGQAHGRSGSGGSNGGSEKGIVYDDSRFRGATITSDYPFGPGQGLRAFSSPPSPPTAPSRPSLPAQQQSAAFLPPSQNPFLDPAPASVGQYPSGGSTYPYNSPNSAGAHSLESHYTHEDPFYTPPMSQSHSPNPNLSLQPALIPALTVTSPHNTQYLPRVPSGSTIFSQQGLTFGGQVQGDGASTYSQQSFEGLAYDYRDSNASAAGGGALPPGGLRGSYGQASIDSFYGGPASGGVKGPTITVQY